MAAILVMAAIGAWAIGTERVSYVITHGVSMNPVYYKDDLVIIIKADSYQIGDIAAYYDSARKTKVLHRIIGGDAETGFIFKGDNNQSTDAVHPIGDKVLGRAMLHVPKGGVWLRPVLSPTGLGMLGFLFISGAAAKRSRRDIPRGRRKKKVRAMSRQGGPLAVATAVITAVKRLPPIPRTTAVVAALVAVLGLVLAVLGWMKPTSVIRPADPLAARSLTFSYDARVPQSPAYDGTTVTAPDPVFRKLASRVNVHAQYHGDPGAFDISMTVTAASGWHTTQQLLAAQKFSTRVYDATVPLDLDTVQDRADAAAKVIGVSNEALAITVNARVTASRQTAFIAPLKLQMTPVLLSLASGASLQTTGTTSGSSMTIRTIGPLTAAQARSWAVLLLLLAAVVGAIVYVLARRASPAQTRVEIERLYPQLLVHVEPMPSPPGKPVVNVDNFPALAKLAERYGQMVLTWRRPDADDFVVRDEGITYRYRVPLDEPVLQNVELINRPGAGSHRRKASSPSQVS